MDVHIGTRAIRASMASLFFVLLPTLSIADPCDGLLPTKPATSTTTFEGEIDGNLSALFKTGSLDVDLSGTYKQLEESILQRYPNADKLYIYDRMIYFLCILIRDNNEMNADQKTKSYFQLLNKMDDTGNSPSNDIDKSGSKTPKPTSSRHDPSSVIRKSIDAMSDQTLESYLGQIFFAGLLLPRSDPEKDFLIDELFKRLGVGGTIFYPLSYQHNDDPKETARTILQDTQRIYETSISSRPIPPFIATDHEGGNASGLTKLNIATALPSAMALGATRNRTAALAAGIVAGRELSNLGFNTNFAPVADVIVSDENNVIQDRAFGGDAELVGALSLAYQKGQSARHILSTAKHFPGHGSTEAGFSSPGLPTSYHSLNTFKASLLPFRSLAQSDISFIMTSHFKIESLTEGNVSFNKGVVTNLLRGRGKIPLFNTAFEGVSFRGIVVADNLLEPSATADRGRCNENVGGYINNVIEVAQKSFLAGHDMFILSHISTNSGQKRDDWIKTRKWSDGKETCWRWAITLDEFKRVYRAMSEFIFHDPDDSTRAQRKEQFRASLARILTEKTKIVSSKTTADKYFLEKERGKHQICADELFAGSFTVIPSRHGYAPLDRIGKNDRVLIFFPTRFNSYNGIEEARAAPGYENRLLKNVKAFDFPDALRKYFLHRTTANFEMEALWIADDEMQIRASRQIELIKEHKSNYVIFLINKNVRWLQFQNFLRELNRTDDLDFDRKHITAIITSHATMLRAQRPFARRLLNDPTTIVAYSGYGYRAQRLIEEIKRKTLGYFGSVVPVQIDNLQPLPSFDVQKVPSYCNWLTGDLPPGVLGEEFGNLVTQFPQ